MFFSPIGMAIEGNLVLQAAAGTNNILVITVNGEEITLG
mgnify:CR=1 FL=1